MLALGWGLSSFADDRKPSHAKLSPELVRIMHIWAPPADDSKSFYQKYVEREDSRVSFGALGLSTPIVPNQTLGALSWDGTRLREEQRNRERAATTVFRLRLDGAIKTFLTSPDSPGMRSATRAMDGLREVQVGVPLSAEAGSSAPRIRLVYNAIGDNYQMEFAKGSLQVGFARENFLDGLSSLSKRWKFRLVAGDPAHETAAYLHYDIDSSILESGLQKPLSPDLSTRLMVQTGLRGGEDARRCEFSLALRF